MFYLRAFGTITAFILASIYGVWIAVVRRDRSRVAHDYAEAISRLVRPVLGLRVEVEGAGNLHASRPCVYVGNHQSEFDVPVLAGIYPENTVIVGKKELTRIPFFGWIFTATGNILVDRKNNPEAVQRLQAAEGAIRERGVSVLLFPEGTRGKARGELLPFKKGAFYLAIAAQVPIVPFVVSPLQDLFDAERRIIRPGKVRIRVLEPVSTAGLTEADVGPLIQEVRGMMLKTLRSLESEPRDAPKAAGQTPRAL